MAGKLNLDIQTILDKQFAIDFKGYDPKDVDGFLDQVIQDYQTYQDTVQQLTEKSQELEKMNASLRAKLIEVEGKARVVQDGATTNINNIDLLKRISRLEEEVFNQKNQ